ncbi:Reverse transcriptase RNA-dependent DNA polymerase [Arabidopsis suecica]|uniref:Reverse transcriptase RNA-dependent DNA polymerase n=1 Tax=Arabidopsis suecica TaxID=45249 RepID=A0A8T1ZCU6_ARASU|nr:Reverse transcriptase RNA-dependent DNA polymerase [Arabidopsis suecica]
MEKPKKLVTSVVLQGRNYLTWSRTTKTVLCGRGLWSHVISSQAPKDADEEEEEEKEATIPEEDKWFQEDQTVLALLQNSLEASILEGYSYCETAKELWDTLKNVYGNESNLTRVFEVKKAINELSQEDLEFTKHFGKFRSLWSELESLRPGTLDPKILHERREQDKVFALLLTLNPSYNDLIKHLLRSEKLPSLDEVCSQIQKEQGSSGLFGGKGELSSANKGEVVANKGVYRNDERKALVCEHCKKKGHIKDKCWILHPHLKPAKFKEPKAHLSLEGQDDQDQPGSSKSRGEVNKMEPGDYVRKSDLEALIKSIASLKDSGITYFSHKPSDSSIIIDSGASHHMISNSNLLNNIEPALGNVIIANGDKVPIKGIGNLRVFDKNSKAFYMPKFTSNLLSVKRATKDLNCYAIFGPNDVYFQDIETGKLIGEGGSKGELYVLEGISSSSSSSPISFKSHLGVSFNVLWHARLGHPHVRALKLMLPSISFDHTSCEACILVPGEQRNKLDAKSTRCMFLGYSTTQKGYKCYDPANSRTYVSRDVKFLEDQGYHDKKDWESLKDLAHSPSDRATSLRFLLDHLGNKAPTSTTSTQPGQTSTPSSHDDPPQTSHDPSQQDQAPTPITESNAEEDGERAHSDHNSPSQVTQDQETQSLDDSSDSSEDEEATQVEQRPTQPLRRSERLKFPPSNWKNTRVYFNQQAVAHPTQATCSLALVPQDHQAFLSKICSIKIPQTYEEAMQVKEWRDAIQEEIGAMTRNHTWDEEELPSGKRTVSSRWIFTIKYKSNGDIERYKARLVARGFTQTYGADYKETFAPVAKLHTVRVVLSLATNLSWELWQMDVKNAFLQGELEDDVYMTPPPGLEDTIDPGKVWRLRKAIYGLKQSPRAWYHKLSRTLKDHGFKKSESDHTLFTLQSPQGIVVVLIYVDDLIISGDNKEGINTTKTFLKSTFDIKDLGELKYFLGIEVCRSPEGLFLSQRKYTLDLLNETGYEDAKPAKTPLEEGYKVDRKGEKEDEKFNDAPLYRKLVGKLIYLTNTRPDICFAVNQVSQHMQAPTVYHWSMVERILRYLKGSSGQGIWMGKNSNTELVGYCDADYAGDRMDRRSTTGYCTFLGGNLVTWKTKKQKVVSCSSAESEYRAMKQLTNELTWLKALLKDLRVEQDTPITMHCDNKAAIYIASNSVFHERTKHIEVDCHKVREKIVQGVTLPCYTRSEDQLADIFTKAASLKSHKSSTYSILRNSLCKSSSSSFVILFSILLTMENTKIRAPVTLKGGNYLLWARTMKTILCGRGFWPHIIKSEAPRETTTNEEGLEIVLVDEDKWFQEDQMVLSVLQNSLEASILEGYSYCETPKDLWETLQNVFGNQSNLSRVFEIKKAINELTQGDMEFTQHFGKFRSLWAELEMLRPNTLDPAVINERREQDKVFGLLFTLNPGYNDLIKHLLRADKLQNLEEVCSQIQKEQGSLGLFGSKGELVSGNSSELASANRGNFNTNRGKAPWCDHCKRSGHAKEKCWILHPHLKPARREPRANQATGGNLGGQEQAGTSSQALGGNGAAMMASSDLVRRSDLDALIKALKESSGNAYHALSSLKPLIVDSGASHHMISDSKLMKNIEPALGNVIIANGDKIPVKGLGDLELFSKKSKAFYMPTFTSNLLSVKKATTDLNCYAIFGPNDVHFQDIETSRVLGHGGTKDGLYVLEDTKLSTPLASHFSSVLVYANNAIWHARLGHPHSRALGLLLPSISFKNDECEACILGKHCKSVFPKSNTIYENCFDLVHSDVWTSPCLSRENQKYFVTFIDEKSKYTWLTLLPSKDRVLEAFTNFQNYVTNHYNAKIKIFRSDNGGEYTSHAFKQHLAKHGIIHQTSCPYTPQQNGVAERKNRHLMEVARSMMFHTNVPKRFWSDAVVLACYLINRIPTKILQDSSPFEVLNKNKPSINHLRVFGCVCFVLIGEQRNKLEPKSVKGMFIGYSITQKGYKCYIPETKKVLVSRDVKFVESKGYYEDKNWEDIQDLTHSPSDRANNLRIILERLGVSNSQGHTNSPNPNPEPTQQQETPQHEEEEHLQEEENIQANIQENILEEGEIPSDHEEETTLSEEENLSTSDHNEGSTSQEAPIALRRSERLKFPPSNWKNTRVYYNSQAVAHPIQAVCTIAHFPEEHQVFLGQIDQHWIPQTYEEAIQHQVWRDAIAAERQAMEHNHTWEEGELPRGKKAVTSKWVFTIKYKSNGDIERYKARLVARGFTQTYGEDYRDTFAPVAKLHTVRVVLSLATNLEWELWQMDVKNAFLQGELEEEVYMKPPPGLEDHNAPGKVFKLKKAIYGLKQSPRAWYHKLSTTLLDRGFKKSEADNTLFTLPSKEGIVVILVYVDDIIISGNDKVGIQETKAFLKSVFDIKDLGELKYFLGIEVCRSKEGLFLSQRKYTLDLLSQVGKLGAKPAKTPLEDDYKANRKGELDNKPFEDVTQYRRLVGKLIYLTITRPDICFAVNVVSQHMQAPTLHHWNMVTRILKYLKGAPGQGIWMGCNKNTELVGYCDADYAGDTKDRRSTTGYCTFIGGNLVTWRSKKQKVVSLSSAEAEYRAMRKLTTELMWLKALLKDFGIDTPKPITMHCDNQAAIHIASNSVFHERTKHIEVDCHKVREQVQLGVILPCYTESEEQLADIFTKGASTKVFLSHEVFYTKVFNEVVEFGSKLNLDTSMCKDRTVPRDDQTNPRDDPRYSLHGTEKEGRPRRRKKVLAICREGFDKGRSSPPTGGDDLTRLWTFRHLSRAIVPPCATLPPYKYLWLQGLMHSSKNEESSVKSSLRIPGKRCLNRHEAAEEEETTSFRVRASPGASSWRSSLNKKKFPMLFLSLVALYIEFCGVRVRFPVCFGFGETGSLPRAEQLSDEVTGITRRGYMLDCLFA